MTRLNFAIRHGGGKTTDAFGRSVPACYMTLGVPRDAEISDIKRAYRVLAMAFHPDHFPADSTIEAPWIAIVEAYDILSDTSKRSTYDRTTSRTTAFDDYMRNKITFEEVEQFATPLPAKYRLALPPHKEFDSDIESIISQEDSISAVRLSSSDKQADSSQGEVMDVVQVIFDRLSTQVKETARRVLGRDINIKLELRANDWRGMPIQTMRLKINSRGDMIVGVSPYFLSKLEKRVYDSGARTIAGDTQDTSETVGIAEAIISSFLLHEMLGHGTPGRDFHSYRTRPKVREAIIQGLRDKLGASNFINALDSRLSSGIRWEHTFAELARGGVDDKYLLLHTAAYFWWLIVGSQNELNFNERLYDDTLTQSLVIDLILRSYDIFFFLDEEVENVPVTVADVVMEVLRIKRNIHTCQ